LPGIRGLCVCSYASKFVIPYKLFPRPSTPFNTCQPIPMSNHRWHTLLLYLPQYWLFSPQLLTTYSPLRSHAFGWTPDTHIHLPRRPLAGPLAYSPYHKIHANICRSKSRRQDNFSQSKQSVSHQEASVAANTAVTYISTLSAKRAKLTLTNPNLISPNLTVSVTQPQP
jgi:hypothetical protein